MTHTRKHRQQSRSFENNIVLTFLTFLNTTKLHHWATRQYSTHKATDELHSSLSGHVDKFVETLLGINNNRFNLSATRSIPLHAHSNFIKEAKQFKAYLISIERHLKHNPDLVNIRDEMVSDINQFLYLATLS